MGYITILTAVSSCGLPTYSYLYPPAGVVDRSDPESGLYDLIFQNAYENNSSVFQGYEIYYRIYDPLDPDTSVGQYLTDKATITSTSSSTTLENLGFSRLYTSSTYSSIAHSSTRPAFAVENSLIDQNFSIRLNFNQELPAGDSFDAVVWDPSTLSFSEPVYLYRYAKNPEGVSVPKFFDTGDFDIGDDDMPDSIDIYSYNQSQTEQYYLYISFYAFSYGRDIDDVSKSIYSIPVYLGTLKFNSDLTNESLFN